MCGIAGALDPDTEKGHERVKELNRLQRHRGPDHSVTARSGAFVLGNTRLAILDPSEKGNQPFRSQDGRFTCVFNGEIFNFLELAKDYGLTRSSGCDGEVICALWERMGADCLRLFRGMYAVALVDEKREELTLARDPFGIKPLYIRSFEHGSLAFASEPRALAMLAPSPALRAEGLASYLHLGAVGQKESIFEGIRAVAPNERVDITKKGSLSSFSILPHDFHIDAKHSQLAGDPAETFTEAVRLHLRSDVPSALLLSAGFDSGSIALAAKRANIELNCVTVAGLGHEDETTGAKQTARHLGLPHIIVPAAITEATLDHFFQSMQTPSVDGLNTFLVCKAIKDAGYKVALSGLGGDESLGGYLGFRQFDLLRLMRLYARLPDRWQDAIGRTITRTPMRSRPKLAQLMRASGPREPWDFILLRRQIHQPDLVYRLTGVDPLSSPAECPSRLHPTGMPFLETVDAEVMIYMRRVLLPDADTFSMSHSIELRVPFIDPVAFPRNAQLTAATKMNRGKEMLARSLADNHLSELVTQPKRGFTLPMGTWVDSPGPVRAHVDLLRSSEAPIWQHIDRRAAQSVLGGESRRWVDTWSLAALNSWLDSVEQRM